MKKVITTHEAPKALGPYSQAIAVGPALYCSGQIGLDPATGQLAGPDVETQAGQALQNVQAVLAAAGMTAENVVKASIFMTNIADFQKVNALYADFFAGSSSLPARSALGVAALPAAAKIEVEVIAVKETE